MKKIKIAILFSLFLAFNFLTFNLVKVNADTISGNLSIWNGCYGNYNASNVDSGVQIEFNGVTVNGYNDNYIQIDLEVTKFNESVWGGESYTTESIMQYCLIDTNNYNPNDWNWGGYSYNGIYILTRNSSNYLQVSIDAKTPDGIVHIYGLDWGIGYPQATGQNGLIKIVLQKEEVGYSLFLNGAEYGDEAMAGLPHSFLTDEGGKTYFAYQSYRSASADGTDTTFILKDIVTEKPFALSEWTGCYDNYGAFDTPTGINIEFDGHSSVGFDGTSYLKCEFDFTRLNESIFGDSGYTSEDLVKIALLSNAVDPTWENTTTGLYFECRNFGGMDYYKIYAVTTSGNVAIFEMTTDKPAKSLKTIELVEELTGYSLYLNGVEYGHEQMATLPHGFMLDSSSKTYFGYQSYSTYSDDTRGNIILHSITTKSKNNLVYKVDGETYKTIAYSYGASITPEAAPTKTGYTFSGWSDIPSYMGNNEIIVSGTFTINSHNVVYKVDGETYKTTTYNYGAAIIPETAPTKTGYTFSGWSTIPETMPDEDVTITGTFAVNSHTLTYKVDGETYKTATYNYGEVITPESAPTKTGYTFSGWSTIPETMPDNDLIINGSFNAVSHSITYIVDGEVYKTVSAIYGTTITPEAAPTKTGYTFSGWSTVPETMPDEDVTITGTFAVNSHTLTYKVDGETYKTIAYSYGEAITPETAPTKTGYTFSGWSTVPETMPDEDITITGTFAVNSHTLTYKVDGETYKTATYNYGEAITPEVAPTREGYEFNGWSTIPTTMPDEDITITGMFSKINPEPHYTIEDWDGCYGNYGAFNVYEGLTIVFDGHTKNGFEFNSYIKVELDVKTLNESVISGAAYLSEDIMKYGFLASPADPTWDNTVMGLFIETRNFEGKDYYKIFAVTSAGVVSVFEMTTDKPAKSLKTIELVEELTGYSLYLNGVEYGHEQMATLPHGFILDSSSKTYFGYQSYSTYSDDNRSTFVLKNISMKGKHNVVYMLDGETYKTIAYSYGASITPEAAPTKTGYTFSGWSTVPETMPDEDITITGTFAVNSHTLTYKVDGETYKTATYNYGEAITPEAAPTREGYEFNGWSTIPTTMPDEDVVVYGTFKLIENEPKDNQPAKKGCKSAVDSMLVIAILPFVGLLFSKKRKEEL